MAKRFKLNFDLVNDAFAGDPSPEVARILREAADKAARGDTDGVIYDVNGNAIGRWRIGRA